MDDLNDLDDIKMRVDHLPADQKAQLRAWFLEKDYQDWDTQIARDLAAGKLDAVIAEAKADRDAVRSRDL